MQSELNSLNLATPVKIPIFKRIDDNTVEQDCAVLYFSEYNTKYII